MNLAEFRETLAANPGCSLRFALDKSTAIADHFHVTEVGRVEKQFVDCGGKPRSTVSCVLQTLVANDTHHRLSSDKLAGIMRLVEKLELPADAPVEVEHQERSISLDAVTGASVQEGVLTFQLAAKKTACLAEDACGIGAPTAGLPVLDEGDCCGASGCC